MIMKTSLCTLFIFYCFISSMQAQNIVFADSNFKACLLNMFAVNTNGDSEIQQSEAAAARHINCTSRNITDLSGVENFTNLIYLSCRNNNITTIDLSNNPNVKYVIAYNNQLNNLILPANDTALAYLDVSNNQLTNLVLPPNTDKVFHIDVRNNQLANLTLPTNNTALVKLYAQNNQLTNFTFPTTAFPKLDTINISNNQLTNLTLPPSYPSLITIDASNNQLTSLDVSNGVALRDILCDNNQLTSLKVPPLASLNTSRLRKVSCRNNKLTSLRIQTPSILLDCGKNPMDSLWIVGTIFSGEKVICDSSQLVYIGTNKEVEAIDCSHNRLEDLFDLLFQGGNSLKELDCSYNRLDTIITGYSGMLNFNCSHNLLKMILLGNRYFVSNSFDSRNNPNLFCIETRDYLSARNSWLVDPQTVINDVYQCQSIWSSTATFSNLPMIELYPNPTTSNVQMNLDQVYETVVVYVYNSLGQVVQEYNVNSTNQLQVSLPNNKGVYLLQLQTETGNQTFKVIKE